MATLGISGAGGTRFERFKASESLLPSGYPEQPEVTDHLASLLHSTLSRWDSSFAPFGSLVFHRQLMWFQTPVFSPPTFPFDRQ